jgi:hypothetical protein
MGKPAWFVKDSIGGASSTTSAKIGFTGYPPRNGPLPPEGVDDRTPVIGENILKPLGR